jgi:hypothetical protein
LGRFPTGNAALFVAPAPYSGGSIPIERGLGRRTAAVTTLPVANKLDTTDPPILLAILIAARRVGNRLLESVARRELEERYGIRVSFERERHEGVSRAT